MLVDRHLKVHAHSESSWQLHQEGVSDLRSAGAHHSYYIGYYFEDTIAGCGSS
jgi:hypothetical protein